MICLVWGSSFILMKKAALGLGPFSIAWGRVAGGVAAMACWWIWRQQPLWRPTINEWLRLGLLALLGYVWPYSIQPYLVREYGSALIAMTVSLTPLATIATQMLLLGQRPNAWQLIGVCGALGCLLLLLREGLQRSIPLMELGWALSVPLAYATCNTLTRRWFRGQDAVDLSGFGLGLAAIMLIPGVISDGGFREATAAERWMAVGCVVVLGVVGTGLAIKWFNELIQEHGPLFAGMVTNIVPILAVAWGWWDREAISGGQLLALAGVVSMVVLVQWGTLRQTSALSAGSTAAMPVPTPSTPQPSDEAQRPPVER
jgi:drug/metabolite transporter (DMT)-like permease